MEPTGIIFAALDCDLDVIEAWNRWYDLEHTPPNLSLDGVVMSNRYVATPALHAARQSAADGPFSAQHASFLTVYTLTGDPQTAFDGMSGLRDVLVADGRMEFPEDKKIVRQGDVLETVAARAAAATKCPPVDVPFMGHTGIIVRQCRDENANESEKVLQSSTLPGVNAVWALASRLQENVTMQIFFVEGDLIERQQQIGNHLQGSTATIVLFGAFERITQLHYPWADAMRNSSLPPTIRD